MPPKNTSQNYQKTLLSKILFGNYTKIISFLVNISNILTSTVYLFGPLQILASIFINSPLFLLLFCDNCNGSLPSNSSLSLHVTNQLYLLPILLSIISIYFIFSNKKWSRLFSVILTLICFLLVTILPLLFPINNL